MAIRLTQDEFISKAKEIHKDYYDYSKVKYINNKTKICIICPEHGEFWQLPYVHLRGANCPKCRWEKQAEKIIKNTDEKIKKVYSDDLSIEKIAELSGVSERTITEYIKRNNIKRTYKPTYKLKYSYEDCYNAAKQCQTLKEFKKKFSAIKQFSDKYGYTKQFTWLKKRVSPGYWTKELAIEEAKKYTTKAEFCEKNQYVHNLSWKMGWMEEMYWLDTPILTKEKCFERARKYTTVKDFNKNEPRSYQKSLENGWINEMEWLKPTIGIPSNPYWTFEKVKEVASECKSRNEFYQKYPGAATKAKRKGWFEKLGLPTFIINEPVYFVYSYDWDDLMTAYIGLSYRYKERDDEHHGLGKFKDYPNKSPVYRFSNKNNVDIPQVKYHYEHLTLEEAQTLEDKIKNEYIDKGYNVLNKGATGKGIGSYGNVGIKWNYEATFEEAKKYMTGGQFATNSPGAYDAAKRNNWLKDYIWMTFKYKKV